MKNNWVVLNAVALYLANVPRKEIICAVLGHDDIHPSYMAEWVERLHQPFPRFFGALDFRNQQRLIAAALEKYGAEAEDAWGKAEAWQSR
jgi:hypothetical protein